MRDYKNKPYLSNGCQLSKASLTTKVCGSLI